MAHNARPRFLIFIHIIIFRISFFSNVSADLQLIIDQIWSLPKLIYCHFDLYINEEPTFCLPTIISSSLKYLYLPKSKLQWNQINQLFLYLTSFDA
jgi:hypothetical protein